jgi:lipopolysaccharide/colanic/teichoic acid biosynthesis glycosyltransferase
MGRVIAGALVLAGLPVHLVICALIWLGDRGSPLYRARRIGKTGVRFVMFKYRTMRTSSAAHVNNDFKSVVQPNDPRVTRLGRFLRAYGIDELPQLLNIVRGDMNWIGPRPDESWMWPNYGPSIRQRVSVKPGITGLAQIFDGRDLSTAGSYAIDLWYIRHRGFWMDLYIAAATPAFIAGFRSVGWSRLQALMSSDELYELESQCSRELETVRGAQLERHGDRQRLSVTAGQSEVSNGTD